MRAPPPIRSNRFHDLDEDEVARIFADQAAVASDCAVGDETDWPRKKLQLRGPPWFVISLATVVVVTVPFWMLPALYAYKLIATAIFGSIWLWRFLRRVGRVLGRKGSELPT